MTAFVDGPALLAELGDFFPSLCTIQELTGANRNEYGVSQFTPATLAAYVDIPCRVAPINSLRASEARRPDMTVATQTHDIALAGYYPAITSAMQAVIAGITYNILGVKSDGNGTYTTLQVERVTV